MKLAKHLKTYYNFFTIIAPLCSGQLKSFDFRQFMSAFGAEDPGSNAVKFPLRNLRLESPGGATFQ